MSLALQSLWQRIADHPDHVFLTSPGGDITYRDLGLRIRAELARFDAAGLSPGQRLLIRTADEAAAIVLFIAGLLDGLVPVMLTPATPDDRLATISASVDPGLTCHTANPDQTPANRVPRLPEDLDAPAYILFTSGTTQSPSGVTISRRNILANVATISRLFAVDQHTRIFNDMVLAHADGMIQGPIMALANGATAIRSGGFTVQGMEPWLERVRETRATHVITVPTVWSLIDRYARRDDYFHGQDCRALMSVAAKLDTGLWLRLERRFGRPVYNQYGLTETVASALYAGPHPEMGARGTLGKPVDCEARIVAPPSGASTLPPGAGELQLRGDNIFQGYWNNASRTAESFTPDGWLKSGDIARQLPDGSYEILGRSKSVIMMAGFFIRPDEIDEAVMKHPAVADSVTVGLADAEFGEIPVTAVVLKGHASESDLTAHARRMLEPLKVPKRIVFLSQMPRGISGKPDLKAIAAEAGKALAGNLPSSPHDATLAAEVLRIAARVFRADPQSLTLQSEPSQVEGWDSFSHVTLLLAAEAKFGVDIAADHATDINSLGHLVAIIARQQAVSSP